MQLITVASLFVAALAAPAPMPQLVDCTAPSTCHENVQITDFWLRKNNDTIQSVSFKLTGEDAKEPILCSVGVTPSLPSKVIVCNDGKAKYSLGLIAPKDATAVADMALYHETGQASGLWNEAAFPPHYCRAGGNGLNDFICSQVVDTYTVVLTPSGPFQNQN